MGTESQADKSEQQWREELDPEAYAILREAATEPPFSGEYVDLKADGMYHCRGCGAELFSSDDKYDSGTGWPSFTRPVSPDAVEERVDRSHGMVRTEALCASCGSHLGHVFPDGPAVTGLRYCMNSASLDLERSGETGD